ncbi:hypothetical protein Tco_1229107 [Tanacetum coccineum]
MALENAFKSECSVVLRFLFGKTFGSVLRLYVPVSVGVETTIAPATAEEKAQRRLELKARSTLLMGIPNEHQLKFNSIKDAKSLLSNSEVSTDSNCSSSCLENVKILKEQNEQLLKDLRTSKLNVIAYKTGFESVEARLLVYKKNESIYEEDIKVLNRKFHLREVAITELRRKLELAQKQKDEIQLTIENFENSSKSLSKLIDCQIVDNCKKVVRKNFGPPIIEDWVSNSKEKDVPQAKIEKKTIKPSFTKIEFVKPKGKTARKTAKQVE